MVFSFGGDHRRHDIDHSGRAKKQAKTVDLLACAPPSGNSLD
jgi:hypothetical protein